MENLKVVGDEESFDWRDRSFVRVRKGGEVEDWAPPTIPEDVNLHHCGAESALGLQYALDMIEHLRTHRGKVVGDRLCTVVKEIVDRGRWTGVEIAFFNTLGDFIASGMVPLGHWSIVEHKKVEDRV